MRTHKLSAAQSYTGRPVKWMLPGLIPYGKVTILGGTPGLGKSQFLIALAANQSRQGQATVYIGEEDGMEDTVRPRLVANHADLDLFYRFDAEEDGEPSMAMVPGDVPLIERAVKDVGASLVIIDPIGGHLDPTLNSHSDHSTRAALAPLARMAHETQAAVVCVMHRRKSKEGSPLDWLNGGSAFGGVARSVLLFGRDKDSPPDAPQRYVCQVKSNLGPAPDALSLLLENVVVQDNGRSIQTSRIIHVGDVGFSPFDLE